MLEAKHDLLKSTIDNFQHYMVRVRAELKTGRPDLQGDLQSQVIDGMFLHGDQITERLGFIKFYAQSSSKVMVDASSLNVLWEELVTRSPAENDRKLMYQWLSEVCDQMSQQNNEQSSHSIVSLQDLIEFYR